MEAVIAEEIGRIVREPAANATGRTLIPGALRATRIVARGNLSLGRSAYHCSKLGQRDRNARARAQAKTGAEDRLAGGSAGRKLHCCVISDVSEGGARLELPVGIEAPQIFVLSLTPTGSVLRYCEVRWRRGSAIGVRFVNPTDLTRAEIMPAAALA
jgi:hypothetical protein